MSDRDIVERLRTYAANNPRLDLPMLTEAADTIEDLRALVAETTVELGAALLKGQRD